MENKNINNIQSNIMVVELGKVTTSTRGGGSGSIETRGRPASIWTKNQD